MMPLSFRHTYNSNARMVPAAGPALRPCPSKRAFQTTPQRRGIAARVAKPSQDRIGGLAGGAVGATGGDLEAVVKADTGDAMGVTTTGAEAAAVAEPRTAVVPQAALPTAPAQAALPAAGETASSYSRAEEEDEYKPSADELKAMLLDSLYGTERGVAASSEVRGEISELITQLEAANPSSDPNDVKVLGGCWKLVYTQSPLSALLALNRLPFVSVGDITQTIDPATGTVVNKVVLSNAFSRGAFSSTANFEIRSPKLLSVKFVSNTLATPQLLQDVDLPTTMTILGQTIDLTQVKEALAPARSGIQSAVSQISSFLERQPDRSFDIPKQAQAESWLLTTYIDDDVRVARGDGGAVFVLVKEGPAPSAAASTGYGTYGTGAWKDDPIGNRPPVTTTPAVDPIWTPPSQQAEAAPPLPVTPPAMNAAAQIRGSDSVDLNSY
mmetsp:Transcript_6326/g.18162  ORF Transcript_6326/g.18162 Transcript_6326/m.18162 type:complete len:440 (+) Transcript_6326:240-1559(+)